MSLAHHAPRAGTASALARRDATAVRCTTHPVPAEADSARFLLLEEAVTVALSALDYPDPAAWGDALTRALCALADADKGAILLPGAPWAGAWRTVDRDGSVTEHGHAFRVHEESTERLQSSPHAGNELVLWARDDLADGTRYVESSVPAGHTWSLGLRIRTVNGTIAAIAVHGTDATSAAMSPHVVAAFRAIAPAFRAGADSWQRASTCRSNVARMLDSLADAALLFDVDGTPVHANPAAERLTLHPAQGPLRAEAQRVAWALGAIARRRAVARTNVARAHAEPATVPSSRDVRIGAAVYRLRGTVVGEHLFGSESAVLVTIAVTVPEPRSDDDLRREFGLTAREVQVTRLMAEGLSNNEIADRIGVRFFTARNHVERTLAKLRVASRTRVGPLLRNELPELEDTKRVSAA